MTQLIQPDLSVSGELGFCLEYASRKVFHNPAAGTTAWNAWLVTVFKHTDQNFPKLSFPVWFSGAQGAGHVAVYTPQGIYSSPYNAPTGHNVLTSIADVESHYGVKYVGWSEDILGLRVIKENTVDVPNDGDIINAKRASTGVPTYQPTGPELDYYKQLDANGKPIHGWHDLLYDTMAGMQVLIDDAKNASFKSVGTINNIEVFEKA